MMTKTRVFHGMENFFAIFPYYGKIFSTPWKNRPDFSTQWKTFSGIFHTMERMFPRCGKLRFRACFQGFWLFVRGCGAEPAAPLVSRRATRLRGRGTRRQPTADSVLSRTAQQVRRRTRAGFPFPREEEVALRRNGGATGGALFWSVLLKNVRGLRDHTAAGRKARPQSRTRLRGRDGAGRGHESAPGRQAADMQVAPRFSRSEKARGELPAAVQRLSGPFFGRNEGARANFRPIAAE